MEDETQSDGVGEIPECEIVEQDPLRKLQGKRVVVRGFDRETGEYVEESGTLMLPWALDDNITADDFDDDAA